mmetsp:Transcript_82807/g.222104  ORF Transcript_82807/g.222104 Transcript_82807/m.222104 type:complete len:80 (-) Transcript_82807:270-509(-)
MPPREQTAARQNNGSPNSSQSFGLCSKKKWVVSSGDLFALPVAPGVGGERGDNFEVEASSTHDSLNVLDTLNALDLLDD